MPIINIDWLEGRDDDQKRAIAREFTEAMVRIAKCPPEAVTIIFTEHPRTEIAKAGKLLADQ